MCHLYYSKVLKNIELLYLIKISGRHKMKNSLFWKRAIAMKPIDFTMEVPGIFYFSKQISLACMEAACKTSLKNQLG